MIGTREGGSNVLRLPEHTGRIGTAAVDAGLRGGSSGSPLRVIEVVIKRNVMRKCADVGGRQVQIAGQFSLYRQVELIGQWPLIIPVNGNHTRVLKEARILWSVVVRERI